MVLCAAICVMVCYREGGEGGKWRCLLQLESWFVTGVRGREMVLCAAVRV